MPLPVFAISSLVGIAEVLAPVIANFLGGFWNRKNEENFQKELQKIQEENKKALNAALAPVKAQQEIRDLIRGEMFKKEQELLNFVNTEVAVRFDQLIELHIRQNVHNTEKCKQIEDNLHSLANIEKELREILTVVN